MCQRECLNGMRLISMLVLQMSIIAALSALAWYQENNVLLPNDMFADFQLFTRT